MPENMLRYTPPPRLKLIGIVTAAVLVVIVVVGLITRVVASRSVSNWTDANAIQSVSVIDLETSKDAGSLVLPGNVQAINAAPIYARVSGYLKKWYVDIGTPVKAGQLLAEIDVPDQDQQLAQAKADYNTALANQRLSAQTAKRYNMLGKANAIAPQLVDEANGDLAAKSAATASAKANMDRLSDLTNFKRITAPFDGIVTSRGTDVGQLVNVGTAGATPLFTVADDRKVRIQPGYGLEGAIPDITAGRVIREYMAPKFRNDDYAGGLADATAQLVKLIDGEPLPEPISEQGSGDKGGGDWIFALLVAFIVAQVARGIAHRMVRIMPAGGQHLGAFGQGQDRLEMEHVHPRHRGQRGKQRVVRAHAFSTKKKIAWIDFIENLKAKRLAQAAGVVVKDPRLAPHLGGGLMKIVGKRLPGGGKG